ncbi:MAG: ABC transporter permease [Acidimicrobiia bacterium]|nr:ABC transporter permease [Acidimicrobiia bacterium]
MRLAIAELRRNKGRYFSITAAIGLIVFLVLILAGLADGLYYGSTGAYRNGNADLYSYSQDSQRSFVRSEIPIGTIADVREVPGVTDAGGLGIQLGSTTVHGALIDVALIGHQPGRPGAPSFVTDFSSTSGPVAVADVSLEAQGVEIGDRILLTGSTTAITVVEFVEDSAFLLSGTLWTDLETWFQVRSEIVPELAFRDPAVQAIAVTVESPDDAGVVAGSIDDVTGFTDTVTVDEAVSSLPGVEQQQGTFQAIIWTSFIVVGVVTALFFALITLEKRNLIAILKAIGSTNRSLLVGILGQGLLTSVGGFILGFALSRLVGFIIPAEVPIAFLNGTAQALFIATIAMGLVGAALSFRRISKIDPATALGGAA